MLPIDFEGANITLGKPKGWTDEQCMTIKAARGIDETGHGFFLTAWQPSKEDIEAINAGRPIWLKIVSDGFPPVALLTFDENNEVN